MVDDDHSCHGYHDDHGDHDGHDDHGDHGDRETLDQVHPWFLAISVLENKGGCLMIKSLTRLKISSRLTKNRYISTDHLRRVGWR